MGRGRQKAKATKVARKLKYYSPETDRIAERVERELAATSALLRKQQLRRRGLLGSSRQVQR